MSLMGESECVCLYVHQTRVVDPNPLNALLFVLIGDFSPLFSPFCRQTVTKALTRHVSELLIEDKQ